MKRILSLQKERLLRLPLIVNIVRSWYGYVMLEGIGFIMEISLVVLFWFVIIYSVVYGWLND